MITTLHIKNIGIIEDVEINGTKLKNFRWDSVLQNSVFAGNANSGTMYNIPFYIDTEKLALIALILVLVKNQ